MSSLNMSFHQTAKPSVLLLKMKRKNANHAKKKTITLLREPTDLVLLKHEQDCSNNKTVLKIDSDRTIQSPGISIVLNNIMLDPC